MDRDGVQKPADASSFDIHVSAAFEVDRLRRAARAGDAFVEADGGADGFLEGRVIDEVGVVEGLFDHGQVKAVHLLKEGYVFEGEGCVTVDVDGEVGERVPNGFYHVKVPSYAEFEFDAG
jgi:hypothetical protein